MSSKANTASSAKLLKELVAIDNQINTRLGVLIVMLAAVLILLAVVLIAPNPQIFD